MNTPKIIKGSPKDKWSYVQSIQNKPFVYIHHNGSKWLGESPDDVQELINVLSEYALNFDMFGTEYDDYVTENPCSWAYNPKYNPYDRSNNEPQYIDGDRFYKTDGVFRFSGNFLELSHGFCIETNHKETIQAIGSAIFDNISKFHNNSF